VTEPTPKDKRGRPIREPRAAEPKEVKEPKAPKQPKQTKQPKEPKEPVEKKPEPKAQKSKKSKKPQHTELRVEAVPHTPSPRTDDFSFSAFQVASRSAPQEIRTLADNRPVAQPRSGGGRRPQKFDPSALNKQQEPSKKSGKSQSANRQPKNQPKGKHTGGESVPKHVYSPRETRPAAGESVLDATARFLMPRSYEQGEQQEQTAKQKSKNGSRNGNYRRRPNSKKRQG
jgi:hypothetical protein